MATATMTQPQCATGSLPWMNRRSRKRYNLDLQILARPVIQATRKRSTPSIASSSDSTEYSNSSVTGLAGTINDNTSDRAMSSGTPSIRSVERIDSATASPISPPRLKTRSSSRRLATLPSLSLNTTRFSARRSVVHPSPVSRCSDEFEADEDGNIAAARADLVALLYAQVQANQAQIEANAARMAQLKLSEPQIDAAIRQRQLAVEQICDQLNAIHTGVAKMEAFPSYS